jgi:hypothetical protein
MEMELFQEFICELFICFLLLSSLLIPLVMGLLFDLTLQWINKKQAWGQLS